MSTDATDETNEATDDKHARFAELNVGDDEFVIYDRENYQAWIQSTAVVDVGERR